MTAAPAVLSCRFTGLPLSATAPDPGSVTAMVAASGGSVSIVIASPRKRGVASQMDVKLSAFGLGSVVVPADWDSSQ
jgi:hypothetical protein